MFYKVKKTEGGEWTIHLEGRPVCAVNRTSRHMYILTYGTEEDARSAAAKLNEGEYAEGYDYFSIPNMAYWSQRLRKPASVWNEQTRVLRTA